MPREGGGGRKQQGRRLRRLRATLPGQPRPHSVTVTPTESDRWPGPVPPCRRGRDRARTGGQVRAMRLSRQRGRVGAPPSRQRRAQDHPMSAAATRIMIDDAGRRRPWPFKLAQPGPVSSPATRSQAAAALWASRIRVRVAVVVSDTTAEPLSSPNRRLCIEFSKLCM